MKKIFMALAFCLLVAGAAVAQTLRSPNGNLTLDFRLLPDGTPVYSLQYKGKDVVKESKMGFRLRPSYVFNKDFAVTDTRFSESDTTWKPVWGENSVIRDNHKEMFIALQQKETGWLLNIRFRLFDDGLGFRYEFPVQKELRNFTLDEETTEFRLTGDHKAFWLPGDYDTNEYPTTVSLLSEVALRIDSVRQEALAAKSFTPNLAVQTPLMLKSADGLYINIHEAALVNYPAMCLNLDDKNFVLSSHLTPDRNGALYGAFSIKELAPQIFSWLNILDVNVLMILILMICVASFTIISGLLIIMLERINMIGILKALGATNMSVRRVFIDFSVIMVGRGMLWGNAVGLVLCFVQKMFHVVKLDSSVYYIDSVPIQFNWLYIVGINVLTIVISAIVIFGSSFLISVSKPARTMNFE